MPFPTYAMPQGYRLQNTPAAGALAYQPPQQQQRQPAYGYQQRPGYSNTVASDRLPAMPEMMRPAQQPSRPALVRGGAPEESAAQPPRRVTTVAQADWKPIHIPSPGQLGITTAATPTAAPALRVTAVAAPEHYDLATVTAWLDGQGVRSCQRERLAEGVRFVCSFAQGGQPEQTLSARGVNDEEALKALVQEVIRHHQTSALSLR